MSWLIVLPIVAIVSHRYEDSREFDREMERLDRKTKQLDQMIKEQYQSRIVSNIGPDFCQSIEKMILNNQTRMTYKRIKFLHQIPMVNDRSVDITHHPLLPKCTNVNQPFKVLAVETHDKSEPFVGARIDVVFEPSSRNDSKI